MLTWFQATKANGLVLLFALCVAFPARATTELACAVEDGARESHFHATTVDDADAGEEVFPESSWVSASKLAGVRAELEELALRFNTSVPSWEARADEVRRGILQGAGLDPLPVRQLLYRRAHDKIVKNGYTIENMALEISPGYYLVGNLYRPLGRTGKVPAIAHPIGHFKRDGWLTRTQPEMQAGTNNAEIRVGRAQTLTDRDRRQG